MNSSCGSRAAERLKERSGFEAVPFPKLRSGHVPEGWASAGAVSEVQRQRGRAPVKRGKAKKREKVDGGGAAAQSQRWNPGASDSGPAGRIYEPRPARAFSAEEARATIGTVLEGRLKEAVYQPQGSALAALELAECVKAAVKALGYQRYKIVCYLVLGATRASDLSCSSRAVWSPAADTYAEFCFRNRSLFALCLVFAVYQE
ncbi:dynein light chain Tctex-type 5-A [Carcharodon carcharias]|uniref:dynein light chain Tctex-type 5-A n=1 Tax=Carcharodon carcharias TaxID=13397 RepID=UPI001B7DF01E|nr:dynein light chain Tctex-type 5-A [Carcharodon carcharias]